LGGTLMARRVLSGLMRAWDKLMLDVHIDKIGKMAIVECEGRIVRSESAFRLREAVTSQISARIIVIDLSEVTAVEGGGLGMLVFLQRWTFNHAIQFKLFNPRNSVLNRLERANPMQEFDMLRFMK
jgi:anti-anti-sigma regulatory factor